MTIPHEEHLRLCAIVDRRLEARPPVLQVQRAPFLQRTYGWAVVETRTIRVYWNPFWPRVWTQVTHLHELVHLSGKAGCAGHGTRFKRALLRAAEAAWGVDLGDHTDLAQMDYRDLESWLCRRLMLRTFLLET